MAGRAIGVDNVSYTYPGQPRQCLKDVSLAVAPGELVLLAGRSGCGKSTLGFILKGLIPELYGGQLEGRVEIAGLDVSSESVTELASKVGLVMQDPEAQLCNLFARDEVAFGVENLRLDPEQCRNRALRALEAVGLGGLEARAIYEFSGGEKQRLAVASVLAMDCPVLIFDEPTANLDPRATEDMIEIIRGLKAMGKTIVLVDHEPESLLKDVDHLIVLDGGRVAAQGAPAALLEEGLALSERHAVALPELVTCALTTGEHFRLSSIPFTLEDFVESAAPLGRQARPEARPLRAPNAPDASSTPAAAPTPGGPAMEIRDLWFSYPGVPDVLRGATLSISEGETVAIVGPNGSGKSTLAKCMVGLRKPTSGEVLMAGRNLRKYNPVDLHARAGYVFQCPEHQFLTEEVYREVAYGPQIRRWEERRIRDEVTEALRLLKLDGLEKRHPYTLSGGEKRRLSVATMLVLRPQILVLDEPSYGQDPENLHNLVGFIFDRLRETGVTISFITHDMGLVASRATKVIALKEGQVLFQGTPRDFFYDPDLVERSGLIAPPVVRLTQALSRAGKIPSWVVQSGGCSSGPRPITLDEFASLVESLSLDARNILDRREGRA